MCGQTGRHSESSCAGNFGTSAHLQTRMWAVNKTPERSIKQRLDSGYAYPDKPTKHLSGILPASLLSHPPFHQRDKLLPFVLVAYGNIDAGSGWRDGDDALPEAPLLLQRPLGSNHSLFRLL